MKYTPYSGQSARRSRGSWLHNRFRQKTDKTIWSSPIWRALGSIGTLLAVVIALSNLPQVLWERRQRPIVRIGAPSYGHLRWGHESGGGIGFISIEIQVKNTGKSVARSFQTLLTAVEEEKSGKWDKLPYWVPINLDWMLDEYERMAHGKPTRERDLVPNKPYIFNLGRVVKTAPITRSGL